MSIRETGADLLGLVGDVAYFFLKMLVVLAMFVAFGYVAYWVASLIGR